MEDRTFCQSCSMPLDDETLLGTEKDGSLSHEYCTYCYQNGAFINPRMTLDEMRKLVREKMEEMELNSGLINMTVAGLSTLKRWNKKEVVV